MLTGVSWAFVNVNSLPLVVGCQRGLCAAGLAGHAEDKTQGASVGLDLKPEPTFDRIE